MKLPPGTGVVPVLKEVGHKQLKVVGTAFFLTRYGLFATAGHVLEELVDRNSRTVLRGYVLQDDSEQCFIRRIVGASLSNTADIGIGQADNRVGLAAPHGPPNLRAPLSFSRPQPGQSLVSFAYPENAVLDFRNDSDAPCLRGDFIEGVFRAQVDSSARPFLPYPHYETSLEIRSGASGCPVFAGGRVVGIACRGWDFRGGEYEGDDLSSILPATQLLPLEVGCAAVPPESWEYKQIPARRRSSVLTCAELVTYGHIDVGAL